MSNFPDFSKVAFDAGSTAGDSARAGAVGDTPEGIDL